MGYSLNYVVPLISKINNIIMQEQISKIKTADVILNFVLEQCELTAHNHYQLSLLFVCTL